MIILVDLDATVVDIFTPWLAVYNKEWKKNLKTSDLTSYEVERFVEPKAKRAIFDILNRPGFFEGLRAFPGAIAALKKLHSSGHEILIVTSPKYIENAVGKVAWLRQNLPFIPEKNLYVCSRKELICGDVLIDDSPHNIESYRSRWPNAHILTIEYPYNKHLEFAHKVSYKTPAKAWKSFVEYIMSVNKKKRKR